MSARRRTVIAAAAAAVALVVTAGGYAVAHADGGGDGGVLGPGMVDVTIGIEHSRFDVDHLVVRAGTMLHITVRNDDPIAHELVIGDDDVHRRHADGTEAHHTTIPGEVSVGPLDVGHTVYVFDEPGTVRFACHLPGHVAYGMDGTVEVVAR